MNKFKRHLSHQLRKAPTKNPISFNLSEQLISFIAFLISLCKIFFTVHNTLTDAVYTSLLISFID